MKAQEDIGLQLSVLGLSSTEEQNAFWTYANNNGKTGLGTYGVGEISGIYAKNLDENWRIWSGASILFSLDREIDKNAQYVRPNQYHAGIQWKNLELRAGAWQRPTQLQGISSTNGDLLWSNNALPIPGVVLQTWSPVWIVGPVGIEGAFGHYWMEEDRVVSKPLLHYKKFVLNLKMLKNGIFRFGLHHYAQWGGDHEFYGPQPDSFQDYLRIVRGQEGDETALPGDQRNKLGNHLGSFQLDYHHNFNQGELKVYYQSFVEDETGVDGRNFPDGIYGIHYRNKKNTFFKGLVYEHINSMFQGGEPGPSRGLGDNYFNNGYYRTGWTYKGRIIGMPFFKLAQSEDFTFSIESNKTRVHHLGLLAQIAKVNLQLRLTHITNQGLNYDPYIYSEELKEFFTELRLKKHFEGLGQFQFIVAGDIFNLATDTFTVGLGYRYQLLRGCRAYDCPDFDQHFH